ncbi:MAG TPA: hypothetical protein VGJ20_18970 [Xanthobacteraceae bacterium]
MSWYFAKMFQDGRCAEMMRRLPGIGADFQHLAKRANGFSGRLGGVIRTRVGDYHDPQRIAPAGKAVGCE